MFNGGAVTQYRPDMLTPNRENGGYLYCQPHVSLKVRGRLNGKELYRWPKRSEESQAAKTDFGL